MQEDIRLLGADQSENELNRALREGRFADAERACLRVIAMREAALGQGHPEVALALLDLGEICCEQRALARAETAIQRALAIEEGSHDGERIVRALNALANVAMRKREFERARDLFSRAVRTLGSVTTISPTQLLIVQGGLATAHRALGEWTQAETLLQSILTAYELSHGKMSQTLTQPLSELAAVEAARSNFSAAEALLRRIVSIERATNGAKSPATALALIDLGKCAIDLGELDAAREPVEEAIHIFESLGHGHHGNAANGYMLLAELNERHGDRQTALTLYQQALEAYQSVLGLEHPQVAVALTNIATVYAELDDFDRADPVVQRALFIFNQHFGPYHAHTQKLYAAFRDLYANGGKSERLEHLLGQ